MKKRAINAIFILSILIGSITLNAQGTWNQKANFGGNIRGGAVGFSIGNKGYVGTGVDSYGNYRKDFWEYDPLTDLWTQKADVGGLPRNAASGFSVGSYGYIGTGTSNDGNLNDFWKYNQSTNVWVSVANFGGSVRCFAEGFSIGNYGYIASGYNGSEQNDFWQYDPSTDTWAQKSHFSSIGREGGIAFSIGNYGYFGTGWYNSSPHKDFWEYDPSTNTWTQKADFGGNARTGATGFSIGNKGYIGTGQGGASSYAKYADFWEYDPSSNMWIQRADFSGTARQASIGFSIGNKGYIGTGEDDGGYKNDFWEYNPDDTDLTTGITPQNLSDKISVYPNPLIETSTIILPTGGEFDFILCDASGREVKILRGRGEVKLEREGLPAGIYIYQVVNTADGIKIATGKIMIE